MPDNDLFEKLTKTSSEHLSQRVYEQDDFTKGDLERTQREKEDNYKLSKNLKTIKFVASWGVALSLGALMLLFLVAFSYLFYLYITDVAKDASSVKVLLKNWLDYILIAMATLFVQKVFNKNQ